MVFVIICNYINITLLSFSWLICFTILVLLLWHVRLVISKVSVLLIFNTYVTMLFTNTMMLTLISFNLYGNTHDSFNFEDAWCDFRAFLTYTAYCNFYYSCLLQAMFRLFRVVFYKKKIYQSRGFFLLAIVVQWILSFILDLPNLLPSDYAYIPEKHKCWLPFQEVRGLLIAFLLIYIIPLALLIYIYIYIIHYIRHSNNLQQRRKQSNARDLTILKRIVIIIFVAVGIGVPTLIVLFYYIFTKYLLPYAYDIQDISLGLALLATSVAFTMTTPEIRKLFNFNSQQIYPTTQQGSTRDQRTQTHPIPVEDSQ